MLNSPLRYPGSKQRLAPFIKEVLKENLFVGSTFVEAYAGGASTSLHLLGAGIVDKAVLIERDPLVAAFWRSVCEAPDQLTRLIKQSPITLNKWKALSKYRNYKQIPGNELPEMGFAGLFFNRTCFSGIIGAGPIGGMTQQTSRYKIDCRFNKEKLIDQINEISRYSNQIEVVFGDALQFMREKRRELSNGEFVVYLDPPYYMQGKRLYRYNYQDPQHKALAEFIAKQDFPWIVSYDEHPRIRQYFGESEITSISLFYEAKKSRRADELLISNIELREPQYAIDKGCYRIVFEPLYAF